MSSMILKLHIGLVIFLNRICSNVFVGGYSFFYCYRAGMLKQNHCEQIQMSSSNNQIQRTKRILALQEATCVTDRGMVCRIAENEY